MGSDLCMERQWRENYAGPSPHGGEAQHQEQRHEAVREKYGKYGQPYVEENTLYIGTTRPPKPEVKPERPARRSPK